MFVKGNYLTDARNGLFLKRILCLIVHVKENCLFLKNSLFVEGSGL